jgi:hypothetical protein
MRRWTAFIFLFLSLNVFAEPFNEVVVGIRQSTAERVSTGERTSTRPDFGLGIKTESFASYGFSIKLGLMYERRTTTDIFAGVEHNPVMQNIDLLTHISYKISDEFAVFGGPNFSVVLNKDCKPASGPCLLSPNDPMKYFVPVEAGVDIGFLGNYGAEVFYEWISQEYWENTFKNRRTWGLNLKYKF